MKYYSHAEHHMTNHIPLIDYKINALGFPCLLRNQFLGLNQSIEPVEVGLSKCMHNNLKCTPSGV